MTVFSQLFLKPGTYRVGKRAHTLSRADLADYVSGTRKALKAGLHVPVLTAHTNPGDPDGGPQVSRSALDCKGWLKGLTQRKSDGALVSKLDITDPTATEAIKNGSVKFTSPEMVEGFTDGTGRKFGRIFRHFALTPKPRAPAQGPMVAMQFSLDDLESDDMADDPKQFADDEDKKKPAFLDDEEKPGIPIDEDTETENTAAEENPDMPPDGQEGQKAAAIVANLEELGVMLPADFDFGSEGAMDIMLAALKTSVAAKQEADTEPDEEEEDLAVNEEAPVTSQFSEHADPQVRKLWEERNNLRREKSTAALSEACSGLPPALASKLQASDTVQFDDEGNPKANYTPAEVAELVKSTIPAKMLQLSEDDVAGAVDEVEHPEGDKHFSDTEVQDGHVTPEQAKEVADELDKDVWHPPSRRYVAQKEGDGFMPGKPRDSTPPQATKRRAGKQKAATATA